MEKEEKEKTNSDFDLKIDEMAEAGLAFGHRVSRTHPKMKPYISGVKNTIHLINLKKTAVYLKEALEFIKKSLSEGKVMILIGTKIQAKDLVKETAEELKIPYVIEKWLGGTFTNFKTIQKRIEYFKELEKKKETGQLNKYTKKERIKIDRELKNLETKFGGIKNMEKLPDIIFVMDMKKDGLAIKEARKKGIKVVAVADTNVDPTLADYPIPANDDSISSIKYILDKLKEAAKKT